MSVTKDFLKDRANGNPITGQWNKSYSETTKAAKRSGSWLIVCWSNGDKCGFCQATEKCMMTKTFKDWMKKESESFFLFQCGEDSDKGEKVHDWIYKTGEISLYPGFLIVKYDNSGKSVYAKRIDGNTLRQNGTMTSGAKHMVANIKKIMSEAPYVPEPTPPEPIPEEFKIRLNEKITTAQANKILDAIDKNDGYCPCQAKGEGTKCHCRDFLENKAIGDTCICNLYVKMAK